MQRIILGHASARRYPPVSDVRAVDTHVRLNTPGMQAPLLTGSVPKELATTVEYGGWVALKPLGSRVSSFHSHHFSRCPQRSLTPETPK
jgi:hypothetical protein